MKTENKMKMKYEEWKNMDKKRSSKLQTGGEERMPN